MNCVIPFRITILQHKNKVLLRLAVNTVKVLSDVFGLIFIVVDGLWNGLSKLRFHQILMTTLDAR